MMTYSELVNQGMESKESAFRRGYRSGYITALQDIQKGFSQQDLWNHWVYALLIWESSNCGTFVIPPSLNRETQ